MDNAWFFNIVLQISDIQTSEQQSAFVEAFGEPALTIYVDSSAEEVAAAAQEQLGDDFNAEEFEVIKSIKFWFY